jgi:hypothetical protein
MHNFFTPIEVTRQHCPTYSLEELLRFNPTVLF